MIKLTLKQLTAIRELAATNSFTVAAGRLNTTQSNLSTMIQEAESILGTRLFDRTTKTVGLTEVGREFASGIGRILDDLQENIENVHIVGRLARGNLAIGITPLLSSTVMPSLLARYNSLYPDITLRLEDNSTAALQSLLVSRDIELAIGTFANAAPEITVEKLFDDALVVLAHRSLGLSDQISWAELATYRMVSIVNNSSVGQIVEKTLWSVNRTRMNALVQSHHWLTVIALTKALNGVCVVPDYAASLQDNTLQKIELVDPTVRRPIDVAALSNKTLSAAAQEFKSLLREQFGKMA